MKQSITKRVSRSVAFQFIHLFISTIIGIIVVPVLLKTFGVQKYGVLELIISLTMINYFLEFGLGSTVVKFTADYRKKDIDTLNTFVWTFLSFKTIVSIAGMVVAIIIGFNFEHIFSGIPPLLISEIRLACIVFSIGLFITNIVSLWDSVIKGHVRYDLSIIASLIAKILYLLFVLIMFRFYSNVGLFKYSIILFIFVPITRGTMLVIFLKRIEPGIRILPVIPSIKIFMQVVKFLTGMSIITILAQVYSRGSRLILGMITNPTAVAIYGIASRIREPINEINSSILRPLIPIGSELNMKEKKNSKDIIITVMRYESMIMIGISALTMLYSSCFIELWLGKGFEMVSTVVRIGLIPLLLPRASAMIMFYYSKGKTKANIFFNAFNTTIGLLLAILLSFKYGVLGLITGLVISGVLMSIFQIFYFCNEFKVSIFEYLFHSYIRTYIAFVIVVLATILLLDTINISNWFLLFLTGSLSIFTYCIIAYILLPKHEIGKIVTALIGSK